MSTEQMRWLLKVIQPERTLASLPGGAGVSQETHALLLGLPPEVYAAELSRMRAEAKEAAAELLADPAVASMVDRLPLRKGAKVVAFGDSLTSEPQSWAVILSELLAARRAADGVLSGRQRRRPARRQCTGWSGWARSSASSPIGSFSSSARTTPGRKARTRRRRSSIMRRRRATSRSCVNACPGRPRRAACGSLRPRSTRSRWRGTRGLARFGVRFRNEDLARVAKVVRDIDGPTIDAFSNLGTPPPADLLMADGLHFTLAGQKRLALEVIKGWSNLK